TSTSTILVKSTQDDNLEETVNRIEDREYFFNDMLDSVNVQLQELQDWVNNLDSGVDFPVMNNCHNEDEWVTDNPFQIEDLDFAPQQDVQLISWASEDDVNDAYDSVRSWFTSQAKSEEEGSTLPVIDESQLNNWVNKHSEVDSLVNTSLHYQVLYGGKLQSVATLVEGRWSYSWNLTSGGTSYKSPYNFHSCLSKQPKKTPCSAT
ncbi:MAG: hypothetical protein ACKPFF_26135, partial [Planktothrix sp.]